jgi:hypothetical protein
MGILVQNDNILLEAVMNNKTTGIIATVAAAVLCGCPGLFLCLFGAVSAAGRGTFTSQFGTGAIHPLIGLGLMCLSVILIAIPVVVGFFTLRNKPAAPNNTTPIPPAS